MWVLHRQIKTLYNIIYQRKKKTALKQTNKTVNQQTEKKNKLNK